MSTIIDRRSGLSSAISLKGLVRLATTANITLSGYQTIDGVLPTSSEHSRYRRILVKDQTDASENGVYEMGVGSWQRAADFNSVHDFGKGTRIIVWDGSNTQIGEYAVSTAINPLTFVVGSDDIEFSYVSVVAGSSVDVMDYIPVSEHAAILARTSTTDCTAYIVAAIAALPTRGGILDFPSGLIVTDTIRTPALGKPTWFRGTGATVLCALSANSPIFAGVSSLAVDSPFVDSHRHSGFVLRAHASGSTGAAVDMRKWSFSQVSDIKFEANGSGKWTYGFLLDSTDHCYSNRIDHTYVKVDPFVGANPISGALFRGATNANDHYLSNVSVIGTTMQAVISLANSGNVFEWQCRDWHVEGVSGLSTVAFDLLNGNSRIDFTGCWFEDVGDCFSNTSTSTGSVTNCTFSGANVQGIAMPTNFARRSCVNPSDSADVTDYVPSALTLNGSLQLAAGFGLNFGAGDVTASHSTNALAFAGASSGYTFDSTVSASSFQINTGGKLGTSFSAGNTYSVSAWDVNGAAWVDFLTLTANDTPTATMSGITASANFTPTSSDGAALGTTLLQWSDLHGATGFTWNIANGNWLATHSSGIMTVTTGDLRVTNNFTDATSVVTVGGAQTLANKTLTTPVIGAATGTSLVATGILTARSATATPAAASAVAGLTMGSAAVGIYWGTGDPNTALTAAQGSVYFRTDGGANSRIYMNTNGTTGWTPMTNAA